MRGRSIPARFVLVLYAAVELLSPLPGFHRHANEIGVELAGPSRLSSRSDSPGNAPACSACAILGMSALVASGSAGAISTAVSPESVPMAVADPLLPVFSTRRGRAPPVS
jgi:hypothetical protein